MTRLRTSCTGPSLHSQGLPGARSSPESLSLHTWQAHGHTVINGHITENLLRAAPSWCSSTAQLFHCRPGEAPRSPRCTVSTAAPALPRGAVAGAESTSPTSRLLTPARAEAPAGTARSAARVTAGQDSIVLGAELALPLPARFLEKAVTAAPTSSSCSSTLRAPQGHPLALPQVRGSSRHISWALCHLLT